MVPSRFMNRSKTTLLSIRSDVDTERVLGAVHVLEAVVVVSCSLYTLFLAHCV